MSGVAQKNAFARTLFNFAYDYKLRKIEKSQTTPMLDKFLFKNTANLLGGRNGSNVFTKFLSLFKLND